MTTTIVNSNHCTNSLTSLLSPYLMLTLQHYLNSSFACISAQVMVNRRGKRRKKKEKEQDKRAEREKEERSRR